MLNDLVYFRADLAFAATAAIFAFAVPVTLTALYFDRRRLSGDFVWSKPFKFALSLAVHFATFAVIAQAASPATQDSAGLRIAALASAMAGFFELGYISIQAARGRHSHFNAKTRLEQIMSMAMGFGAIIVLLPAVVIGVAALTGPIEDGSWPIHLGVAAGLLGGAGLTLVTGMAMGSVGSRFAMAPAGPSRKMKFTGWSLDNADLRPSHFLATHMMQAVPLAAVLASLFVPGQAALIVAASFACFWGYVTVTSHRMALAGRTLASLLPA